MQLLYDYMDYLKKYEEFTDDFMAWEDEDLNDEELAYYMQVQLRINQKLLACYDQ